MTMNCSVILSAVNILRPEQTIINVVHTYAVNNDILIRLRSAVTRT